MSTVQKAGGVVALFEAAAYVVGFASMALVFNPGDTEAWTSAQKLSFLLERKAWFQTLHALIFVAFGIALVVLAVALHERLQHGSPALMKVATPFGLIWAGLVIASGMVAIVGLEAVAAMHERNDIALATSAWAVLAAVQDGLGGGVEVVGGVWVLLISAAAWRSRALPRGVCMLGIVVGLSGVLTVFPPLKSLAVLFGLSQIVWFVALGLVMVRSSSRT